MPINIRADVIDIRIDISKATDTFFVDTNVWFWLGYSQIHNTYVKPKFNQAVDYPNYINDAYNNNAKLYKCTLSFSELAHIIEDTEWKIFTNSPNNSSVSLKSFRHNFPTERQNVINEIVNTWAIAEQLTKGLSLSYNIDDQAINTAIQNMNTLGLDGYDLFMFEAFTKHNIKQIITGDTDFAQIPDIQVFTANDFLIKVAKSQNKLVNR